MFAPQVADLSSDLLREKLTEPMRCPTSSRVARVQAVLSNAEELDSTLMSGRLMAFSKEAKAGDVLPTLRTPCTVRVKTIRRLSAAGIDAELAGIPAVWTLHCRVRLGT